MATAAACTLRPSPHPTLPMNSSRVSQGGTREALRCAPASLATCTSPSRPLVRCEGRSSSCEPATSFVEETSTEPHPLGVSRRSIFAGTLASTAAAAIAVSAPLVGPPPALAVVTVELRNLSYRPCAQPFTVGPGSSLYKAKCFRISGQTVNRSGRAVFNADVFGFVLDAFDEPAIPNRGRLASIAEIPPGEGTFEIEIVVPSSEALPLKLKSFRATGFHGGVKRTGNPYDLFDDGRGADEDDIPF